MSIKDWFIKQAVEKWLKEARKDKQMEAFLKFIEGKRTYFTLGVIAILGAIGALNEAGVTHIAIPEWIFTILAGLGIYTRSIAKK